MRFSDGGGSMPPEKATIEQTAIQRITDGRYQEAIDLLQRLIANRQEAEQAATPPVVHDAIDIIHGGGGTIFSI